MKEPSEIKNKVSFNSFFKNFTTKILEEKNKKMLKKNEIFISKQNTVHSSREKETMQIYLSISVQLIFLRHL